MFPPSPARPARIHLLPVAVLISTSGRTDLSRIIDRGEQERVQINRSEAFVTDPAFAVGTVDDVRPVVALLWGSVSLRTMADEGTALTPPDRDAITAILRLDRTRRPISCDDPVVCSAPTHMPRPEACLLKGVLVAVGARAAAHVSITLYRIHERSLTTA